MPKATRSVQYRYLARDRLDIGEAKLEDLVRKALAEKRDGNVIGNEARARIADLSQEGQLTIWNGLKGLERSSIVQGELLLYKQGFNQTAIEEMLDKAEPRFKLTTFTTDGKSKPVEGALYFAIVGDNVGIIQSNAVTGRWLERYLTWLLKDITGVIEGEDVVNLSSKTSIGEETRQKLGPARSLTIHAQPSKRTAGGGVDRSLREKAKGAGATVLEVLKLMGVGEDAIESIRKDIPEGGRLEGDFLVYIKDKNRKKPISIGTLDHAFRNTDASDLAIEHTGAKTKDGSFHLSEPVRLTTTVHGLDPEEAMEEIVNVLYKWAERALIDLDPDS